MQTMSSYAFPLRYLRALAGITAPRHYMTYRRAVYYSRRGYLCATDGHCAVVIDAREPEVDEPLAAPAWRPADPCDAVEFLLPPDLVAALLRDGGVRCPWRHRAIVQVNVTTTWRADPSLALPRVATVHYIKAQIRGSSISHSVEVPQYEVSRFPELYLWKILDACAPHVHKHLCEETENSTLNLRIYERMNQCFTAFEFDKLRADYQRVRMWCRPSTRSVLTHQYLALPYGPINPGGGPPRIIGVAMPMRV